MGANVIKECCATKECCTDTANSTGDETPEPIQAIPVILACKDLVATPGPLETSTCKDVEDTPGGGTPLEGIPPAAAQQMLVESTRCSPPKEKGKRDSDSDVGSEEKGVPRLSRSSRLEAYFADRRTRDSDASTSVEELGAPTPSRSSRIRRYIAEKDVTEGSTSLPVVLWRMGVVEFSRQWGMSVLCAIPLCLFITIIGKVWTPENTETLEDLHARNLTFNVHIQAIPWKDSHKDSFAHHSVLSTTFVVAVLLNCMMKPYYADVYMYGYAHFKKLQTVKLSILEVGFLLTYITFMGLGLQRYSMIDGPHAFYMVGTFSPTVATFLLVFTLYFVRAYYSKKIRGDWHSACSTFCYMSYLAIAVVESIYMVPGLSSMPLKRKTMIIFVYRVSIQPFLFLIALGAPTRYYTRTTGDPDPSTTFCLMCFPAILQAWSRLTLQWQMYDKVVFTIVSVADMFYGCVILLYAPQIDKHVMKVYLKIFPAFPAPSSRYAAVVDMMTFQIETCVNFSMLCCAATMNWAMFDSRHLFQPIYEPCSEFDIASLFQKTLISAALMSVQDGFVSLQLWRFRLPVSRAFWLIFHNPKVWLFMTILMFVVGGWSLNIGVVYPGKHGECTDFNSGCTCKALIALGELCGCCDPATKSAYKVCDAY